MHDVFVQILKYQETLAGAGLSSLLFRIATNVCLNKLRGERRRAEVRPGSAEDQLLERIASGDDLEGLTGARRLLGRLFGQEPASSRVIAVLHLYDGMTLEEVAREVGMSVSGVRKRLRRLRAEVETLSAEGSNT